MTTHEYYVALYQEYPVRYIGPFRSRKETGNFNKNYCNGKGHVYHYESHRLKLFTGEVTSPEDYIKEREQ